MDRLNKPGRRRRAIHGYKYNFRERAILPFKKIVLEEPVKNKPEKETPLSLEIKKQFSWYRKIFDQLDYSTDEAGSDANIDDEPEWVWNLVEELGQQVMPSFRIRKFADLTPRDVGAYLGQQCANIYAVGNMFGEPTPEQLQVGEKILQKLEVNKDQPGVESTLMALDAFKKNLAVMGYAFPKFEKTLHESFKAALDQPDYLEAVGFFQGFARGLSKPGITNGQLTGNTTATLIYQKLYTHRRDLEKLPSYSALCEFLRRNGVHDSLLGDVRRVQKLCERLKLRLGKRGRPPKKK